MTSAALATACSRDLWSMDSKNPDAALQISEEALAGAFVRFRETASALEGSYARLQAEVARLRRELEQSHRVLEEERDQSRRHQALAEISAMLAHEVRNPLASLELFAGWLMESGLAYEQKEWLGHMQAGIRTLTATVHNVLHWHSPWQIAFVAVDFGQWLDHVAGFLSPLAQQAGVSVVVENHLQGITAAADPHALQQMALNLSLNACRAMPGGGTLWLRGMLTKSGLSKGAIRFEFRDSGRGIASENLSRIFQAGFSTLAGSPGLGLAVCQTIVERHSGRLIAANLPEGGACFRIELPLLQVPRGQADIVST